MGAKRKREAKWGGGWGGGNKRTAQVLSGGTRERKERNRRGPKGNLNFVTFLFFLYNISFFFFFPSFALLLDVREGWHIKRNETGT